MNILRPVLSLVTGLAVCVVALAQEQAIDVSLIQLLAAPEQYHGKLVRVQGFLHIKFEDHALYVSKDHADHLMGRSAVWVSFASAPQLQPLHDSENKKKRDLSYFDRRYVLLEGVFNKDGHGHLGSYGGEVKQIQRVLELQRWYK
jgi:hypothetical protein